MDGIINVYKEAGFTSHDVVAKLRGIVHQKKIGHTGTLDPAAIGVLPVCLGKATKVCELLAGTDKTYQAVCKLGIVTDTQDITGQVLEEYSVKDITEEDIRSVVNEFLGESMQIPPMYSALKVNGKKLYELAREGKTIEREPRKIYISQIDILQIDLEGMTFSLEVTCSKGTYIRTLCHDIGKKLGVGGVMQSLVRTRVADFQIEDALTLAQIENLFSENPSDFIKVVRQVDSLFSEYPKYQILEEYAKKLFNGNMLKEKQLRLISSGNSSDNASVFADSPILREKEESEKCLIYDEAGKFKAIYQKKNQDFIVLKMF